jgi:hypothetical protein
MMGAPVLLATSGINFASVRRIIWAESTLSQGGSLTHLTAGNLTHSQRWQVAFVRVVRSVMNLASASRWLFRELDAWNRRRDDMR